MSQQQVKKSNWVYRKVQSIKSGDSLSVVIPKHMARDLDIKKGDYVVVTMVKDDYTEDKRIMVRKLD